MSDAADHLPTSRVLPSLSAELGRRANASRVAIGLDPLAVTAALNADGVPVTATEFVLREAGDPIEWAEPGFALIVALAFLFEVSASAALQESDDFAVALARSANLQRIYIQGAAGIDMEMSDVMLGSVCLPFIPGDIERMAAGHEVTWADPGLRLAAALTTHLNIALDDVVMATLSNRSGKPG